MQDLVKLIDERIAVLKDELTKLSDARIALMDASKVEDKSRSKGSASITMIAPGAESNRMPSIQSAHRGRPSQRSEQLYRVLSMHPEGMTAAELAKAMQINSTYLYRLFPTLTAQNRIFRGADGRWHVTPREFSSATSREGRTPELSDMLTPDIKLSAMSSP